MSDARWGDPHEHGERDRDDERPRVYGERDRADHDAQQLAASVSSRRRSVPPSQPESVSQSLNQRWRERPSCPASPVTPGRRAATAPLFNYLAPSESADERVREPRRNRTFDPQIERPSRRAK
jgi:hypothetical protein